ncbi:Uncharacterised protein [Mycobacteroides abscessus subsp. abscessus]|nr:Uncharacterised protein [Mycobacteroides abscessus subsp. abscessus]
MAVIPTLPSTASMPMIDVTFGSRQTGMKIFCTLASVVWTALYTDAQVPASAMTLTPSGSPDSPEVTNGVGSGTPSGIGTTFSPTSAAWKIGTPIASIIAAVPPPSLAKRVSVFIPLLLAAAAIAVMVPGRPADRAAESGEVSSWGETPLRVMYGMPAPATIGRIVPP